MEPGPAGPPALPAAERPRAFSPGEELVYQIEALGMEAGKGRVTVGTPTDRDGVRALPIVAQGRTDSLFDRVYSVRDKFITWWDPATGRVIGSDLQADEGGKKHRSRSVLDHAAGKAYVRREKVTGERTQSTYDLPAGTFDIAGAVMELRNRKLEPGTVEEVKVFTGKKTFTMRCKVEARERITVPAGSFDAVRTTISLGFDGKFASKGDVVGWFSADERHIPLRLEAELVLGTLRSELVQYRKGVSL